MTSYECTLIFELEPPVPFTCADGTAIEKGSLVYLADPNTVAQTNTDDDAVIGITAEEKIASDGKTKVPVYLRGIFKGTAGAAGVTAGKWITSDSSTGDNGELADAGAAELNIVGRALETATDLETFMFLLSPCCGQP